MLPLPLLLGGAVAAAGGEAEEAPKRRERRPRPRSDDAVVMVEPSVVPDLLGPLMFLLFACVR